MGSGHIGINFSHTIVKNKTVIVYKRQFVVYLAIFFTKTHTHLMKNNRVELLVLIFGNDVFLMTC